MGVPQDEPGDTIRQAWGWMPPPPPWPWLPPCDASVVGGGCPVFVLVSGEWLLVSGREGAMRKLLGNAGAPLSEPGALATGAVGALEALPAPPVAPPALKPGALLPPLAIAPASPKGVLGLP